MGFKRGGLGKGLGALLSQIRHRDDRPQNEIQEIDSTKIKPNRWQPRRTFDDTLLSELAESIKLYGILQPLIVRPLDDGSFELISGERRLRASKLAGLSTVPAIIKDFTDDQIREVAIIENVQRENLNPVEEARAYDRLLNEFGYSKEDLAAKIGCSVTRLMMLLRLLKLAPQVQTFIIEGQLTVTQALPLLSIENEELQIQTAEIIISEKLSARKVNAFINELKTSGVLDKLTHSVENDLPIDITIDDEPTVEATDDEVDEEPEVDTADKIDRVLDELTDENEFFMRKVEVELSKHFGRQVKVVKGRRRSRLQIEFTDVDDLLVLMREIEQPARTKEEKIAALRRFSTAKRGDKI
ncbi:MAG: ParB/RepB/Spo0J family partition protein [Selenomonadaceae bacterium]|nr:ParB/RepB/Spo0J family partition protein [Selenomonadaceae bacterium]